MAPSPARLSYELRQGRTEDLARRRWVAGLSFVGAGAGIIVGLYQLGILKRLPDLPVRPFNATKVDKAPYAYSRLQTPDGLLMVASYAVTAILAGAGGKDRARDNPILPLALAAKTIYDFAIAVKLGQEEWRDARALCGYCQAATLASLVSVGIALPEARKALDHMLRDHRFAWDEPRRGRAQPEQGRRAPPPARPSRHPEARASV